MSAQLSLCDPYPASHSQYDVLAILGPVTHRGATFESSELGEWRCIGVRGDYNDASRLAREHCLTQDCECWVVDRNDAGYIALRVRPDEYTALIRTQNTVVEASLFA